MNQILAMREKRANLWDAAKAFRETHIGEDGTMNTEDAATYDRMVDDVDHMKTEIDRLERQQAIDEEMNRPTSRPVTDKPMKPEVAEKQGRASDAYRTAFWHAMCDKRVSHICRQSEYFGVTSGCKRGFVSQSGNFLYIGKYRTISCKATPIVGIV